MVAILQLEDITESDLRAGKVYEEVEDDSVEISLGFSDEEDEILGLEEVSYLGDCIPEGAGFYLISGRVKLADGSEYLALLGIDADNCGEHVSTDIKIEIGWATVGADEFFDLMGKTRRQVFPFKYHLNMPVEGDVNTRCQY